MYTYKLEQAIRAASILHKDQSRKGSVPIPYISHLMGVLMIVSDYTDDEATLIGALLHDTLEDTDYTKEELRADFGEEVLALVLAVSEPSDTDQITHTWKDRKRAYAKQLRSAPKAALVVAAADKIHNMRSVIEEYYHNHTGFVKAFGGTLEERLQQYQEIANVLNKQLDNPILSEFNHVFTQYKEFIYHAQKTVNRK